MSKESMVRVSKSEYEELVRDQHKVELLIGYCQDHRWIDSTICLILGIEEPQKEEISKPAEEVKVLLGEANVIPEETEPDPEEEITPPDKSQRKSRKAKIDRGKVMALHNAGWTGKKIAEEMGCSEGLISGILKEEKTK